MSADTGWSAAPVAGSEVWFRDVGAGPPLVLIHGYLVDQSDWDLVVRRLAAHHRCLLVDLPGFGRSLAALARPEREAGVEASIEGLADAVLATVEHALGTAEPLDVVGHSMGGGIALALAARHPERVRRLVVVNGFCCPARGHRRSRVLTGPLVGPLFSWWLRRLPGFTLHTFFRRRVFPGDGLPRGVTLEPFVRNLRVPGAAERAREVLRDVIGRPEAVRRAVDAVRAPTLILWGDRDRIFSTDCARELQASLEDASLVTLEGCGHAPHVERPQVVADHVRAHVG